VSNTDHLPALPMDESPVDRDLIVQFRRWYNDAVSAGVRTPDAITLATVFADVRPSARIFLLRQTDETGFVFYTNYQSQKGFDIDRNPNVSLPSYWRILDRQVHIGGVARRISSDESDAYFQTRSRQSQLGAWASDQSSVIESRK
jgi:pyridoxamine 5'-phosphate oxidase